MGQLRDWVGVAFDRWVQGRAIATALAVAFILTALEHGADIIAGRLDAPTVAWIALSFLVPYVASTIVLAAAVRERRRAGLDTVLLEREIAAINKFPGQNPHPVMRVDREGRLSYANESSAPIRAALGLAVGDTLDPALLAELRESASATPRRTREVTHDRWTFEILPVYVPELDVLNLYGTDVTATKVIDKFPAGNPNPVLRMSDQGTLVYANAASARLTDALGMSLGDPFPADLRERIARSAEATSDTPAEPIEVQGDGRTYALTPFRIDEYGFTNIYGTDVTARKAVDKFPDQNPNPVLRVSPDGRLQYANPASVLVRKGLGVEVGDPVPAPLLGRITEAAREGADHTLEVEADGRVFELLVVAVYEFGFINLYGTDVTAAREVERLLLNILPPSIAQRLRHGEKVIADGFDEMTVLFADVVDFTPLSARLTPAELVGLLNEVFSRFDALADRFELEKIKTIGDAYMVVGGLVPHAVDHPVRVADMGLAMIDAVRGLEHADELHIRVGMHVGPAVAGVIGIRKFIYDVWGDTVNTASRLETTGVPGRIQVTRATCERLRDAFDFEGRGIVELKGKGPTETFLLVGPRGRTDGMPPRAAAEPAGPMGPRPRYP